MATAATCELPPPRTAPLGRDSPAFARLGARQRALAEELLGDEDAFGLVRTRTRADVGSWLGRSRLCACALADRLLLFAPARSGLGALVRLARLAGRVRPPGRPCVETIPFEQLHESTYNQVTGELVLAPAEGAGLRRLKMAPLEGCQLLAQIRAARKGNAHA